MPISGATGAAAAGAVMRPKNPTTVKIPLHGRCGEGRFAFVSRLAPYAQARYAPPSALRGQDSGKHCSRIVRAPLPRILRPAGEQWAGVGPEDSSECRLTVGERGLRENNSGCRPIQGGAKGSRPRSSLSVAPRPAEARSRAATRVPGFYLLEGVRNLRTRFLVAHRVEQYCRRRLNSKGREHSLQFPCFASFSASVSTSGKRGRFTRLILTRTRPPRLCAQKVYRFQREV